MLSSSAVGEVIGESILNVNRKRELLYLQILAVKCYYFARAPRGCLLRPYEFSFLLALWSHFLIRPYIQHMVFVSLLECVIVALPYLSSGCGYFASYFVLLLTSCFVHPVLEFAVDICLILNFSSYSYSVYQGNEVYRDDLRLEIIAIMLLLPNLSIEKVFRAIIFVLCCNTLMQSTGTKLENVLLLTLIILEIQYTYRII